MKRFVGAFVMVAIVLGTLAVVLPTPQVQARDCVFCPQIAIECGPCYNLVHQTCDRCAYCKKIPGCH